MVEIYSPLILTWLRRYGLDPQDAADVQQEVLSNLFRTLAKFERHEQPGAFRAWLRTITANCARDFWRSPRSRRQAAGGSEMQDMLQQLSDPHSGLSRQWDEEHDREVARKLLEMIRPEFEPSTWEAFERVTIGAQSPKQAAEEMGLTVNAVMIAKSRILSRLRQEGRGLID